MADVQIHNEVRTGSEGGWQLCFQWVTYTYDGDVASERGYRFIWRRQDGTLQPHRGQARIPSATHLFELLHLATRDGWFIAVEGADPIQMSLPLVYEPGAG